LSHNWTGRSRERLNDDGVKWPAGACGEEKGDALIVFLIRALHCNALFPFSFGGVFSIHEVMIISIGSSWGERKVEATSKVFLGGREKKRRKGCQSCPFLSFVVVSKSKVACRNVEQSRYFEK